MYKAAVGNVTDNQPVETAAGNKNKELHSPPGKLNLTKVKSNNNNKLNKR